MAVQSLQILYTFVLRVKVLPTFGSKVVIFSARNDKNIQHLQTSHCNTLQHFVTKLCNFTNFKMLFVAIALDFVLLA